MDWERDLPPWPLSEFSRQVTVRPHRWHVQEVGEGDTVLLLHGAGASTHTWRDVIPLLAVGHRVVAVDMPGQGFTRVGSRSRFGLEETSEDLESLCRHCAWQPVAIVGHSAGAAVALRLADRLSDEGHGAPKVIGINPALSRFNGLAGLLYPLIAKALAATPLTAMAFTLGGGRLERARTLIENTGSRLNEEGIALYARLIGDRDHVDSTLNMMAHWSLDKLLGDLPGLPLDCLFINGAGDKAVPPEHSTGLAKRIGNTRVVTLTGLGHLAHEEAPAEVSKIVLNFVSCASV